MSVGAFKFNSRNIGFFSSITTFGFYCHLCSKLYLVVPLIETASDDDALDMSEDDFFLTGSSSDEAEADDEWTDKSTRYNILVHITSFWSSC